ncbi:hypothetical protein [Methylibium sp. Root1272]|uniref:hypothetical protein n=1 Tax=Methylibium sp. Root1272 TaxID=1736441 RepID=UPI0006FC928E|nr:hypothetical protein [Methylibium sp. Root1272]KQW70055.1 hypothetical protein ASC67_06145 [Methylibium sp. Root1272]
MDAQNWQRSVAAHLQNQWPTIPIDDLLEAAGDLWCDEHWRAMPPEEAAVRWLKLGVLSDRDADVSSSLSRCGEPSLAQRVRPLS